MHLGRRFPKEISSNEPSSPIESDTKQHPEELSLKWLSGLATRCAVIETSRVRVFAKTLALLCESVSFQYRRCEKMPLTFRDCMFSAEIEQNLSLFLEKVSCVCTFPVGSSLPSKWLIGTASVHMRAMLPRAQANVSPSRIGQPPPHVWIANITSTKQKRPRCTRDNGTGLNGVRNWSR